MKLHFGNNEIFIEKKDNIIKNIFALVFKKKIDSIILFEKTNIISTFFAKTNVNIIALNEQNNVIYKYVDAPPNKLIEVKNKKKKTNILVLPNNISSCIKIGDALSFVDEYII